MLRGLQSALSCSRTKVVTLDFPRCAFLFALPLLVVFGSPAIAKDVRESAFVRSAWTAKDGLMGAVMSIAQTTDGFLWIAGDGGLFRFDGVRIEDLTPADGPLSNSPALSPLFASADGGLWIARNVGGVSFLKNGKFTHYTEREGLPTRQPRCFAQDLDGVIWAAVQDGLARFDGTRWHKVGIDWNYPADTAWSVVVDRDGTVWAASADAVYSLPRGEKRFRDTGLRVRPGMLLVAPDNSLWLTEPTQQLTTLLEKNGHELARGRTVIKASNWRPMFDRRGGLWMGSWGSGALLFRDPRELADGTFGTPGPGAEAFREADGLVDDRITYFLEDREGSIWVGTNGGLNRLRRRNVSWLAMPPGAHNFLLVPGRPGEIYAASEYAETFALPRRVAVGDAPKNVQFAYQEPGGSVWLNAYVGDGNGLNSPPPFTLYRSTGGQFTKVPVPVERGFLDIRAMTTDPAGDHWVSANRMGVYRVRGAVWKHVAVFTDSPNLMASAATTDALGRVWLLYPARKQIAVIADGRVQRLFNQADLPIGPASVLALSNKSVWAGGAGGLAFADSSGFHRVVGADGATFPQTESILATASGIWLSAQQGIVHLAQEELERVVADPTHRVRYAVFDEASDIPDRLQTLQGGNLDATQSSDGVLWFATRSGVARIDPRTVARNVLPPPVVVRTISGDATEYLADGSDMRLPALTKEVRIVYTALSLAMPERVRFRYRLEGWEEDWRDAGDRREAFYTNLGPGTYKFQVTASNNDGLWNETGTTVVFSIAPAWYQTNWFIAVASLAAVIGIATVYRLRVRQLAKALSVRFDERLAERMRVARELHDTLLQTVQGSKILVDVALKVPTDTVRMARTMEQLSASLERAGEEGRAALNSLRATTTDRHDLADALRRAIDECRGDCAAEIALRVAGEPKEMHLVVSDEIYRIACEAIRNACTHAGGTRVEIALNYAQDLTLRVLDDGIGIDAAILRSGRDSHFGLPGMRERAARINGRLTINSGQGQGTEVVLLVPGRVAFLTAPRL